MSEIVGKRVLIDAENEMDVAMRLDSCAVRYEFVRHGEETEVRYEDSLKADHLIAPFILPPR